MNLSQCQQQLNTILAKSSGGTTNISQLTNAAWGTSRTECISLFGGLQKVNTYVQTVDRNNLVLPSASTTTTSTAVSYTHLDVYKRQIQSLIKLLSHLLIPLLV